MQINRFLKSYSKLDPTSCIGVSVVPSAEQKLKKQLYSVLNLSSRWIQVKNMKEFMDSKIDLQRTGSDRVLCAFGASKAGAKQVIVIDAGSAITVDVVYAGRFRGGMIMPGTRMAIQSLLKNTSLVRPKTNRQCFGMVNLIGKTTEECVRAYTHLGIPLLLDAYIDRIQKQTKRNFLIVGTGGDAEVLSRLSRHRWKIDSDLSFKSLIAANSQSKFNAFK